MTKEEMKKYQRIWYQNNKERLKSERKERYEANKERDLQIKKEWKAKNSQRVKEKNREWYLKNRDSVLEKQKTYKENNKHIGAAQTAHRRAKQRMATPKWFDREEVKYIYKIAKERDLVVDHIVPLRSEKVCGLHTQDNLRCISAELNTRKSNSYWPDM